MESAPPVEGESAVPPAAFRRLADSAPVMVWMAGTDKQCTFFNRGWLVFTGRTMEEERGEGWVQGVHPDDLERCLEVYTSHFDRRAEFEMEYRLRHRSGTYCWILDRGAPHYAPDGTFMGYIGSATDITGQKRAEAQQQELLRALEVERDRLKSIIMKAPAFMVTLRGPDHVFEYVNARYQELVGHRALQGKTLLEALPEVEGQGYLPLIDRVYETGEPFEGHEMRLRLQTEPGGPVVERYIDLSYAPLFEPDGTVSGVLAHGVDVTERVQSRQRLQALSRRLVGLQEQERRSLALELHDELGQVLTSIALSLDQAADETPDEAAAPLRRARRLVEKLTSKVRDLSFNLRPSLLDDLGLLPAIEWYFHRYRQQTGIEVLFSHAGLEDHPLPTLVESTAYRIVQEALTNVARHAGVDQVRVKALLRHETLYLRVEDDGVGFDPVRQGSGGAEGLSGMEERARLLGGEVSVEAAPGAGVVVTATLPVSEAEEML